MKTRKYHDLPYSIFMLPKYDISNKICLTFFYFAFGNPKLLIYAKGLKRIIQPRKKKAWVKAQVQLEPGSQTLLLVAIIKTSDVLALDSLSASTDLCPKPGMFVYFWLLFFWGEGIWGGEDFGLIWFGFFYLTKILDKLTQIR